MFHLLAHLHSSFSLIRLQGNQVLDREMAKVDQKHTFFVLRNFSLFAIRYSLFALRFSLFAFLFSLFSFRSSLLSSRIPFLLAKSFADLIYLKLSPVNLPQCGFP